MRVPRPSHTLRRACPERVEGAGTTTASTTGSCGTDKSCAGSIAAHPCKKRKDGAPSVGMVQCKDENLGRESGDENLGRIWGQTGRSPFFRTYELGTVPSVPGLLGPPSFVS